MTDTRPKRRLAKGILPGTALQTAVAGRLRSLGVAAAAEESGVHREQLLTVAAGQRVLAGTVLRVERWLATAEVAS